ncbi:MAG: metallophosphoesterase [Clostridiales bacterium]|nr:metallophosphoesterase [Clostridiales bacterium]
MGIKPIIIVVILLLIGFSYFQNNSIVISRYRIKSNKLPRAFEGYKIVQLSDLHNKGFGKGQRRLVNIVGAERPDIIAFTGDIIDSRRFGYANSIELIRQLIKIAPIYYVTGNHEWASGYAPKLLKRLNDEGVEVLNDVHRDISIDRDKIYILGIDDPSSKNQGIRERENPIVRAAIQEAIDGVPKYGFKILLSHRPEKLPIYSIFDIDLILSGHAHGGQVRLPLIGGLFAPNQGILPKYSEGQHKLGDSTMVVSRGLGNSIAPQRIFNRPEVVVIELLNERAEEVN